LILCGQIYGPGLGRHGPTKARRGLGPDWATVFTLRAGTARPKNCLGFLGPNPFGTKHDGLGPGRPGTAQFPALSSPIHGRGLRLHWRSRLVVRPIQIYSFFPPQKFNWLPAVSDGPWTVYVKYCLIIL
jgi:hypothetical protein